MEPEKKSNGAIIGLIVIIIILIIGGIYMWQSKAKGLLEEKKETTPTGETGTNNNPAASITSQDSADLDALDQDASNTDTNVGVDVETLQ